MHRRNLFAAHGLSLSLGCGLHRLMQPRRRRDGEPKGKDQRCCLGNILGAPRLCGVGEPKPEGHALALRQGQRPLAPSRVGGRLTSREGAFPAGGDAFGSARVSA